MCSGSCDHFKFWEVSDGILETVKDRDIANHMWPVEYGLSNSGNSNYLEGP